MKRPPFQPPGPHALPQSSGASRLLSKLDTRTVVSALASVVTVLLVGGLILFGQDVFGLDQQGVIAFLGEAKDSPWAFLAVALVFVGLAMVGFPQALLFAGTVAVFGGPLGSLYAWLATGVSAALTFFLGRLFGARWVKKIPADRAQSLLETMHKRGLVGSMVVRWLPTAPFIVVNSICGAAGVPYWKFAVGTGLGILPKLALVAFFTEQLDELGRFLTSGDTSAVLTLIALPVAWVGFMLFCRWTYRKVRNSSLAGLAPQTKITEGSSALPRDEEAGLNLKSNAS